MVSSADLLWGYLHNLCYGTQDNFGKFGTNLGSKVFFVGVVTRLPNKGVTTLKQGS